MTAERIKEGVKLLNAYTAGSFDVWALSGRSKASCRAHVMSVLNGVKTPQSKSGVTAIRTLLMDYVKPEGDCLAIRQRNFEVYCKQLLTS